MDNRGQDHILATEELRQIFSLEVTNHVAATHSTKFLEIRHKKKTHGHVLSDL